MQNIQDKEHFLLNSSEIYREEKWARKMTKKLLALDWNETRKRLRKRKRK